MVQFTFTANAASFLSVGSAHKSKFKYVAIHMFTNDGAFKQYITQVSSFRLFSGDLRSLTLNLIIK
jgi:hypothetical protein